MWRPWRFSLRSAALVALVVAAASPGDRAYAQAQDGPEVEIQGGADKEGHTYTWIISHRHNSPLVAVEIPHFGADVFSAPPGWTIDCDGLVGQKGSNHRGVCRGHAPDDGGGIRRLRSAEFVMRIAPNKQPRRGTGKILLRFADGATVHAAAELPLAESLGEQYVPLIGLAVIFGGFLLVRALRKRRGGEEPAGEATTS